MSEPKESDIAFAKKIAPDLARGMQTYDEYIARGEELGVLARAYKRKWDDLLAGIAAYREEIEASLAPAPAQSREEALALVGQLGSIAYRSNMHTPSGYAEMLKEMEAALRSRPSPQGEDALADERETLEHWDENDIGTLTNALESAIDAYDALRARLASAQSSAQGEEARGMREALEDIAEYAEFNELRQASSRCTTTETSPLAVIIMKARAALERKAKEAKDGG